MHTLKVRKKMKVTSGRVLSAAGALTLVIAATAAPFRAAQAATPASLKSLASTIDAIIADPHLQGAQVGVLVRDAEDGSTLYSHHAHQLLIPASNDKLYTSNAAIKVLGQDYKFTTTVATNGSRSGSNVQGNLYLKGTGDPTMQAGDYDALAAQVASSGIKTVSGNIVADDTFFDHRQLGYNWGWDSNPYYYQPEISALTVAADSQFDIGALLVETAPGNAVGQPAKVTTNPATNFVTIQNETTTGAAGSPNTIAVERKLGINTIVVTGSMPIDSNTEEDISTITDPTGYALSLFRDALTRHGVIVAGQAARGATPASVTPIVVHDSMPLSQLLTPFLKLSNNGIAETLMKAMGTQSGGQGSWDSGLQTELPVLQAQLNVDTSKLQLVDGSGLSNVNVTTPQQTTNLLIAARSKPWFNTWYSALPIAGESDPLVGGTLRHRMVGTKAAGNVHGKTGTLDNVSALSGYVTTADGEKLVFSIMETNFIENFSPKPLEDQIAEALANFSRSTTSPQVLMNRNQKLNPSTQPLTPATSKAKNLGLECSWTKEGC